MSKKVLIFTEEWAGSGHMMAAVAIKQALQELAEESEVTIIGGLGTASPTLQLLSRASYFTSLRYFPSAWQWLYSRDKTWNTALKKPLGKILGKRLLEKVLEKEAADAVIATHAYCLSALAEAKKAVAKPFTLGSVLTDFHVNSFWVHPEIDYYVVAHPKIGDQLRTRFRIEQEKIYANGIPLRTDFARGRDKQKREWRISLGLKPDLFTVLLCNGGAGYEDVTPIVEKLLLTGNPLQIIVVTGTNHMLLSNLRSQAFTNNSSHAIHLLGYVKNMWEWIGAADAVITKPGGLTCAECLAMGTPMVLYRPLPGQERKNSQFLRDHGAAEEVHTIDEIVQMIERWQTEVHVWTEVSLRTVDLGIPDSAYRTAELILNNGENLHA